MTVGNVEMSSGAFVTDLTRDGKTLAVADVLTLMTMDSIVTVAVITVRDSVGAIFRPIVNMVATTDGNRLNAYIEAVKQRTKKPLAEKSAAFLFVTYCARFRHLPITTSSIILKLCDANDSESLMFQVDDGYALKNYA